MSVLMDSAIVGPAERAAYWSNAVEEHFFPVEFVPREARSFVGRVTETRIGPVAARLIVGDPHRIARPRRIVAAGDPGSILLYLLQSGTCRIEQGDRACELAPGDMASHDSSQPSLVDAGSGFGMLVFMFPKWLVGTQSEWIVQHTATVMASTEPLVRVAGPLVSGLAQAGLDGALGGAESEGAADVLLSLLRAVHSGAIEWPPSASRPRALLAEMRNYTLAHLHEPELGAELIARAHFVSTRYVQKLFAQGGSSVTGWIREQRLIGAIRDLRDPTLAGLPIATIGANWGFPDPAAFSRVVRGAYSRSPRELRMGCEARRP